MGQGGGSRPTLGLEALSLSPARMAVHARWSLTSGLEWHLSSAAACATELPYLGSRTAHPIKREGPRKGGLNIVYSNLCSECLAAGVWTTY